MMHSEIQQSPDHFLVWRTYNFLLFYYWYFWNFSLKSNLAKQTKKWEMEHDTLM